MKKHVLKYFSEVGGFRVEDQGLSFLYGGNLECSQGLLGRCRPRGTAFIATIPYIPLADVGDRSWISCTKAGRRYDLFDEKA